MKKTTFRLSIVSVIIFTIFGINNVSAQQKTTFEMLQNKIWVMQFPAEEKNNFYEMKFTTDEQISNFIINNEHFENKNLYYLSDLKMNIFDKQKIGSIKKGKYIIVNSVGKGGVNDERVMIYEIVELTNSDLKLRSSSSPEILSFKSK